MRILDLYCGVGGAAKGYLDAGFDVVGVDREPQPEYVAGWQNFRRDDALSVLLNPMFLTRFDAIHASPPCQSSTALTKGTNKGRKYPDLIPATRELLKLTGLPYIIENVQGAAVRRDLTLCGEMFGLEVIRHRFFEIAGFNVQQRDHLPHRGRVQGWRHGTYYDGPYFAVYGDGGGKGTVQQWQQAMGIDWTESRYSIAEAIPPAFTEHIGRQLMAQLTERAA